MHFIFVLYAHGVFNSGDLSIATTNSGITTSGGNHLRTNSSPISTDVTYSSAELISPPSSTGSGIGGARQGTCVYIHVFLYVCVCANANVLMCALFV